MIVATLLAAGFAGAQEDGSPRKFSKMVFDAFPEADRVRHILRGIDDRSRRKIEEELPFKIHFQELGEHKLHVAYRKQKPVGLMYVRSEQTAWGIADIGWALTLECRVVGFSFANSRSRETRELPNSAFAKELVGRDFRGLKALATAHAASARPAGESQAQHNKTERTVLRSAMKATLVTELVWHDQVSRLADLAMLYEELPGAKPGRRRIAKLLPRLGKPRRLEEMRVMDAWDQGNFTIGRVIRTVAKVRLPKRAEQSVELRWVLDSRGRILRVRPTTSWAGGDLRKACSGLRGRPLSAPNLPGNPLAAIAIETAEELQLLRLKDGSR
ncbi:MAG: hypothetical protein NXI31_13120 [bacterium]|nr:hypothetical protein [bacterium]